MNHPMSKLFALLIKMEKKELLYLKEKLKEKEVEITVNLTGLSEGLHGVHIHEFA